MPVKLSYRNSATQTISIVGDLLRMGEYVLSSINPQTLIPDVITVVNDGIVRVSPLQTDTCRRFSFRRLFFLAAGKAAPWMAASCSHMIHHARDAAIIGPPGAAGYVRGWTWLQGDHPIPCWKSVHAALRAREMTSKIYAGDLFVFLLSGGASSLMTLPAPGYDLGGIARRTREIMNDGASIHELNSYRRSVDLLKAGGLARLVSPGQVISLIVSDVPGDEPEDIGSGPTVPPENTSTSTFRRQVITDSVRYPYPLNIIISKNNDAKEQCVEFLSMHGYEASLSDSPLRGEARMMGKILAQYAIQLKSKQRVRTCVVFGGETTVTVRERGRGGRNLEMALSFAASISGIDDIYLFTLATDGKDGSSPSCGAVVYGSTLSDGGFTARNAEKSLDANDSFRLLSACNATLVSGLTGTNVMDVAVLVVG